MGGAAETGRPVLRVGNNSDTVLIREDGALEDILYHGEKRFVRDARVYTVPLDDAPSPTLFKRWGDWFAALCLLTGLGAAAWCAYRALDRKRRLLRKMRPDTAD